jgi:hypothetical protein
MERGDGACAILTVLSQASLMGIPTTSNLQMKDIVDDLIEELAWQVQGYEKPVLTTFST